MSPAGHAPYRFAGAVVRGCERPRAYQAALMRMATQVSLGIANVRLALPLEVAVLHNAGAALLLFTLVTLLARVRAPEVAP